MKKKRIILGFMIVIFLLASSIALDYFYTSRNNSYILHGSFQNTENKVDELEFDSDTQTYIHYVWNGDNTKEGKGNYKRVKYNEYLILDGTLKNSNVITSKKSIEVTTGNITNIYNKIGDIPVERK